MSEEKQDSSAIPPRTSGAGDPAPDAVWLEPIPSGHGLPGQARLAYSLMVIESCLLLAICLFMVVVEATTRPGLSSITRWATIATSLVVVAHLFTEFRRPTLLTRLRWFIFALAIVELVWTVHQLFHDRIALLVFGCAIVIAGMMLGAAHWLLATRGKGRRGAVFLIAVVGFIFPGGSVLALALP